MTRRQRALATCLEIGRPVAVSHRAAAAHFHGDRERQAAFQLEDWILLQVTLTWTAERLVDRVATAIEKRRQGQAG